jgi:hypothetical protein
MLKDSKWFVNPVFEKIFFLITAVDFRGNFDRSFALHSVYQIKWEELIIAKSKKREPKRSGSL